MRSQSDVVRLALSTAALKAARDPGEELTLTQIQAALDEVAADGAARHQAGGSDGPARRSCYFFSGLLAVPEVDSFAPPSLDVELSAALFAESPAAPFSLPSPEDLRA
jgi:hypothetical protein